MSISLATALILQYNEIRIFAIGPFPNGKYGSAVYFVKDGQAINSIISIQTGEFDTCKKAIDSLDDIVKAVRELDLTQQEEKLRTIM